MMIVTYPGTGTDIVREALARLGLSLEVITSFAELDHILPDGVILLGGCDISPIMYGESDHYAQRTNRERDWVEWAMLRRAMTRHIPILGICRGCQMIAVAHGGSLFQDMYKQHATSKHSSVHSITATGPLSRHIPTDIVNSYHHQAIRNIPDGFKVLARSSDMIVEAIYKPGILGVQWHPELMLPNDQDWIILFEWFVNGLR